MSTKKTIAKSFTVSTIEDGADAPYIELSRSTILYQANNDGYSTASQNFPITYALKVNGNTCTISSINNITISLPTNVTVVSGTKTTSGCTINCTHSVVMSGVITITITGTYNGISYTATGSITVSDSREGPQGEQGEQGDTGARGKVGRFFYYAGIFDVSDTTTQFIVNDAQSPFFAYNNKYWVYNPEYNPSGGTTTMSAMGTPSSESSNWKLMTDDFKYIITEAIFGSYAHFGGAIINGDWEISVYGVLYDTSNNATNISSDEAYVIIDGVRYDHNNAYTKFDPTSPNEEKVGVINFVPNYSVDLKRGWTYQNVTEVNGVFRSQQSSDGSTTYIGAASLLFGYRNNDIFRISCEGSGNSRNVKMQIGAAEGGMTYFDIESRGTFQGNVTSKITLHNLESGTNVPSIVIHKGGIAMTSWDGSVVYKQKSWNELLS